MSHLLRTRVPYAQLEFLSASFPQRIFLQGYGDHQAGRGAYNVSDVSGTLTWSRGKS